MTTEQALLVNIFQETDARSIERKNLNEILDDDNHAEKLNIV